MYSSNFGKYDEKLFASLFEITNQIEIRRIHCQLMIDEKDLKSLFAQIRNLDTKNIISNKVSWFISF